MVTTRRQTKKPNKNTLETFIKLHQLKENLQKTLTILKKWKQIEEIKKKMTIKTIIQRQEKKYY